MILGLDLGNFATKTSEGIIFISKVSKMSNILNNSIILKTDEGEFYIEEGKYDTEYRKVKKQYLKELFLTGIALSSDDTENKIVVGLPLSQYKEDKDELKQLLLKDKIQDIEINGIPKKIIIEDVEVYPESLASVGFEFNGLVLDIGGRTTDVAEIENRKVSNPFSLPIGTLNLYSDYIKAINSKYSLDLSSETAPRIIKNGLKIYGEEVDTSFAVEVFKAYVENIVRELQVNYSIKTLDVKLVGGGSILLYKPFKNRIPNAELIDEAVFSNANGFLSWGMSIWQ